MYKIHLINIKDILITEEISTDRVLWLTEKINNDNYWINPIALEVNNLAIMDGHHRYEAAKSLGLKRIPAVLFNYDTANVQVKSWNRNCSITKELIKDYISKNKIFPYKTTKHIFNPPLQEVRIPVSQLK